MNRTPVPLVTVANAPSDDQLGVGIDRRPGPDVASAFRRGLGGPHVLVLCVAESPDFIALNALRLHVADRLIMEGRAHCPGINQQLGHGVDRAHRHTREIERRDEPSTSMVRIWTRFSKGSLFMLRHDMNFYA